MGAFISCQVKRDVVLLRVIFLSSLPAHAWLRARPMEPILKENLSLNS